MCDIESQTLCQRLMISSNDRSLLHQPLFLRFLSQPQAFNGQAEYVAAIDFFCVLMQPSERPWEGWVLGVLFEQAASCNSALRPVRCAP